MVSLGAAMKSRGESSPRKQQAYAAAGWRNITAVFLLSLCCCAGRIRNSPYGTCGYVYLGGLLSRLLGQLTRDVRGLVVFVMLC